MAITTGNWAKLLYPGLNDIFGMSYNEHSPEWPALFSTESSSRAYEEDLQGTGFGLASVKNEGDSVTYDEETQAFLTRYKHVVYGLGFIITREMYEDDLYDIVGKRRTSGLAFSMRQTKEVVLANIYNRSENSTYTGGDGVELSSSVHPNWTGGTFSNELATPSALSEAALEQACIDIMKLEDDRGKNISIMPTSLHIPVDLVFEAHRILKSTFRSGTADNDANALYDMGKFQKIVPNHYFTSATRWFIRTNVQNGMKVFQRRGMEFTDDSDFDTENGKYKATERYSGGWSDPRGIFVGPAT